MANAPLLTYTSLSHTAYVAPMLDAATEREYLGRIQESDDPVALEGLLVAHLRLVMSVARKYVGRGVSLDDLIAEGNLGLVEAARRFDVTKGNRFATYAAWWVRALIRRYTLAQRRIVGAPSTRSSRRLLSNLRQVQRELTQKLGAPPTREQIASHVGASEDEVDAVEAALSARDVPIGPRPDGSSIDLVADAPSPEEQTAHHEDVRLTSLRVRDALSQLSDRERMIVERRILADSTETLETIGRTMGLSRERVRQIEMRACAALRGQLCDVVA
jgi:RNA polymerase sigma-32 factor